MNTTAKPNLMVGQCKRSRPGHFSGMMLFMLLSLIFLVPWSTANALESSKLASLVTTNLSPAFDPNVTAYTVPQPANCTVTLTATLADPTNTNLKLYVQSNLTTSGATVNAWVCDGKTKVDVVIYNVWTEIGRYTITPSGTPMSGTATGTGTTTTTTTTPTTEATPSPEPNPIPPPLLTTPNPVSRAEAIRFLDSASFGPNTSSIAAVQAVGPDYWMAQQANIPVGAYDDTLNMNQLFSRVYLDMHSGQDQLRQRMMFALSQILVVSANKNIYGNEMLPYVRTLAKHAFGNYRSLLRDMTLNPSMGKYLDLANSMKNTASTAPNENYPRELAQLMTIGLYQLNQDGSKKLDAQGQPIPTYDQNNLRDLARALTGWTYPTAPGATPRSRNNEYFVGLMEPRPLNHDTGSKTLLNGTVIPAGQTVTQDMDAVLDNLFQHPNTPPFIATRLIHFLTTSNPSPDYIERVADVFANNGQGVRGDLWAVLTAILTDPEAVSSTPAAEYGHLKDPLLHVISMGRALDITVVDPNMFMYLFRNLGEQVLTPPTVFSFYAPLTALPGYPELYGPEFQIYAPGLAIQRANFIYQILSGQMGSALTLDLSAFNAVAGNADALVEQVNQKLLQGRMSSELRQSIVTATQATQGTSNRVLGALYLAAISSEFSVIH